jgi:hypothetical protein
MKNLRQLARGQSCMVRLPGICNHNPETTVLAHLRAGFFGMGIKPPDLCGVWACFNCHNEIDRRTHLMDATEVKAECLRALCQQLAWYVDNGIVS